MEWSIASGLTFAIQCMRQVHGVAESRRRYGNKNDKRVWAAVKAIEAYTNAYIKARLKGTDMGKKKRARVYELMETKLQEIVAAFGIPAEGGGVEIARLRVACSQPRKQSIFVILEKTDV